MSASRFVSPESRSRREIAPDRRERAPRGTFRRFADVLTAAHTSAEVVRVVLSEATSRVGAAGAAIFLVAGDEMSLELAGAVGYAPALTDRFARLSVQAPLPIPRAFVEAEAVFVESPEEFRRRYPTIAATTLTGTSFACFPLAVDGHRLGVVAGLLGGFMVWLYALLLPTLQQSAAAPLKAWLPAPLSALDPVGQGFVVGIAVNTLLLVAVSLLVQARGADADPPSVCCNRCGRGRVEPHCH